MNTPLKILFVTTDYSYFTQPITQALHQLGFEIRTFDYHKPNLLTRLIGWGSNHYLFSPTKLSQVINSALLTAVNQFHPHYLLAIKGDTITAETIRRINNLGITTINWYSDWYDSWDWITHNAPAYTFFINMCRATHRKLRRIHPRSFYLPVASYLDPHPGKYPKYYPISFVGRHTPRRERYFKTLIDLGLQIWGYHHWQSSSLKHISHEAVSVQQTRDIIRHSKITVNILNGSDTKEPDQINTRTVETTSIGSFLLVKSTPILKQYFTPSKEVITFTNPTDLRRKAIYYLAHEQERELIAQAGYLRAKREHTFDHRLKQLFSLVK